MTHRIKALQAPMKQKRSLRALNPLARRLMSGGKHVRVAAMTTANAGRASGGSRRRSEALEDLGVVGGHCGAQGPPASRSGSVVVVEGDGEAGAAGVVECFGPKDEGDGGCSALRS